MRTYNTEVRTTPGFEPSCEGCTYFVSYLHVNLYIYIHIYIYIYIYVYVYVSICIYIYIYVYIRVFIYIESAFNNNCFTHNVRNLNDDDDVYLDRITQHKPKTIFHM
jgi:hypothetical protein